MVTPSFTAAHIEVYLMAKKKNKKQHDEGKQNKNT